MNHPLLNAAATPDEDQVLADLIEQWTRQLQTGEAIDWQACARDYPQYAEQLQELLPALQALAGVGEKSSETSGLCERLGSSLEAGCSHTPLAQMTAEIGALGDYRLLREIGRGGMGVVYEADQISLHRRVALKVLPFAAALDGRQLQRFKIEAQAAAQLHHSNIVPVFAVGCEQGVHYYAMQFIEGQTLAQLIRELRQRNPKFQEPNSKSEKLEFGSWKLVLPISDCAWGTTVDDQPTRSSVLDARSSILDLRSSFFHTVANLGIQAAEALEYAHQMGVVHRDIKPANLLIEMSPHTANHSPRATDDSPLRLWVTDFGLARYQTDAGLTGTGDVLGTLRYMSPEQAQGKRGTVDHRTDVYALGMSLYELLTLEPAFSGQTREEVLAQLTTEEPVAPRRLNRAIPIELETIILKSLAKRPQERYGSAQELADDLRRFLEDKPILARRPSLADKTRKWARRHKGLMRVAAVMAGLVVVGLVFSIVMIARERHETEMRRRQARRAVDEMYSQFAETMLCRQPGMEQVEREFLLKALSFYQEFARENSSDPELLLETAKACRRMGDIYYKLGQPEKAAEAFDQAMALLEPQTSEVVFRSELALALNNRGNVYRDFGRLREADGAYRQAGALFQELVELTPEASEYRANLADAGSNRGIVLSAMQRPKEAERTFREALAVLEELVVENPKSPAYCHDLAGCLNNLGNLLTSTYHFREAENSLRRAECIWEKLAAEFPSFPAYRRSLAVNHANIGIILAATARYSEAEKEYKVGQAMTEKLASEFPATPGYRQDLACNCADFGGLLTAVGRIRESEEAYLRTMSLRETLAADYPGVPSYRQEQAASHFDLGQLAFLSGRYKEAERAMRQALYLRVKLAATGAGIPSYRHDVAVSYHHLANLLTHLGRQGEATDAYRQALLLDQDLLKDYPEMPAYRLELGTCRGDLAALLDDTGRFAEAEGTVQDALGIMRALADEFPEMAYIRFQIAVLLDRLSFLYQNTVPSGERTSEAHKALRLAIALAESLRAEFPANPDFQREWAKLQIHLGARLAAEGKSRQAEEAFSKGLTVQARLADDYATLPEYRRDLAGGLTCLGNLLAKTGRDSAAAKTFQQASAIRQKLIQDGLGLPQDNQQAQSAMGGQER